MFGVRETSDAQNVQLLAFKRGTSEKDVNFQEFSFLILLYTHAKGQTCNSIWILLFLFFYYKQKIFLDLGLAT